MLLLENNLVSYTLDSYLDINKFLSLKDEFYYLFSNNYLFTKDVWNAGGIPFDTDWEYTNIQPLLYHTYHRVKDTDPFVKNLTDKNALAYYLKLKYRCFSPYKILHLNTYRQPVADWVTTPIANWVSLLPFDSVDMVSLFFNDHFCPLKFHRDYNYFPVEEGYMQPTSCQDIIWFRFDLTRSFSLFDVDQQGNIVKEYTVEGYSATFNHYNWHGNMQAGEHPSLTIKIEGIFSQEFKNKIYDI